MHSFQPSRGRVFFEVLCAWGMSASFAGAWMQTHATALLGAAGVAAFYGLIHLFDMRRTKSAVTAEPQRIEFEPEMQARAVDVVVPLVADAKPAPADEVVVPIVAIAEPVEADEVEQAEPVEELAKPAPRSGSGRRTGGSRKSSGRRAKTAKAEGPVEQILVEPVSLELLPAEPKATKAVPVEQLVAPWPMPKEPEEAAAEEQEEEFLYPGEGDAAQPHIQPLFEPDPFVRMPRQGFGRRGRL
jgi:hypothetical protein